MNEECINISKCICQRRLMRVLFFSFCNIKIVALINSLLKPPSAAVSPARKQPSIPVCGSQGERVRDRQISRKCIPPFYLASTGNGCGWIYGDAQRETCS